MVRRAIEGLRQYVCPIAVPLVCVSHCEKFNLEYELHIQQFSFDKC